MNSGSPCIFSVIPNAAVHDAIRFTDCSLISFMTLQLQNQKLPNVTMSRETRQKSSQITMIKPRLSPKSHKSHQYSSTGLLSQEIKILLLQLLQAQDSLSAGPIGGVTSMGVFLRDLRPYLCEFWRKPRKTPNAQVNKRDRGLNLTSPVYQLPAQNHSATGGVK